MFGRIGVGERSLAPSQTADAVWLGDCVDSEQWHCVGVALRRSATRETGHLV